MASVQAKPRTGPEPNWNMIIADRMWVMLASTMVPVDLAGTARDGAFDDRRGDHLLVEDDGEALADVLAGNVAETPRTDAVEAESHHRLAGLRVEAGLGVGQHLAGDHRALLDQVA